LYDVLAYIAFHADIIERTARADRAKIHLNDYDPKQQEFLNFVLSQYVEQGVDELDDTKLGEPIPPGCDAGELTQALAELAREVLRNELIPLLRGELRAVAQDEALATAAPPIGKQHLPLIWERPAPDLENQVRALAPRPGAACLLGGRRLTILRASARREPAGAAPGSVVEISDGGPVVACGRGRLLIEVAQVEGRPARSGRDLVNGRVLSLGTRLASSEADATP
jgi:methionyl-tRNA formyltransferase